MKKILWIDVMKGLGILSVVAGHIYGGEISRNIFIFHMPLFFLISGYLFKPTTDYKKYFLKKVVHLLVPYVSFLISFFIPIYVFSNGLSLDVNELLRYFTLPIFGGVDLNGYLGVFWFVTCLFLTQQLMNFFMTKFNSKTLLYIIILMLGISYVNSYMYPDFWLPWNANVVCASLPLFYIGYCFKSVKCDLKNILLTLLGLIVIVFSFQYPQNVYDMKTASYGIPIITLCSSLILTLNVKLISEKLANIKLAYFIFSELGKASMVIMFLHQFIQIYLKSNLIQDNTARFTIAVISSYIIYMVLIRFKIGRALLLGSYKDFKGISKVIFQVNKI